MVILFNKDLQNKSTLEKNLWKYYGIGVYSTKIHVLGEINLDIFVNDNKFFNTFPNCKFIATEDAIKKSLKKHFTTN